MIHGIINIYKEKGYTSHDVVAKLRRIVGQKKIGHTGTLDPDATGVLPVCFGKATKLCDLLTDKDKTYETVLLLGRETDTQDISGTVLSEKQTGTVAEADVRSVVASFVGAYAQTPPMYSAIKIGGKKLYELAREGKTVERKPRNVEIFSIDILEMDLPHVKMRVHCSKGTYIRTLCNDIGAKLGCGGCMEELVRTKVSSFVLTEAKTLAEVENFVSDGRLSEIITPVDAMFAHYPALCVTEKWDKFAYNGNALPNDAVGDVPDGHSISDVHRVRLYNSKEEFIGLYDYKKSENKYKLVKMFYTPDV